MVCETWDLGRRGGHRERGLGGLRASLLAGGGGVTAPAQEAAPACGDPEESRAGFGVGRWGGALMEGAGRGGWEVCRSGGLGGKGQA